MLYTRARVTPSLPRRAQTRSARGLQESGRRSGPLETDAEARLELEFRRVDGLSNKGPRGPVADHTKSLDREAMLVRDQEVVGRRPRITGLIGGIFIDLGVSVVDAEVVI